MFANAIITFALKNESATPAERVIWAVALSMTIVFAGMFVIGVFGKFRGVIIAVLAMSCLGSCIIAHIPATASNFRLGQERLRQMEAVRQSGRELQDTNPKR